MRSSFVCLLMLIALPAAAQIYKYTDANGNTAYSNQPPDGRKSETVELPPLNSVAPPVPSQAPPPNPPAANQPAPTAAYETLALADIPNDEAIRANNGTFTVGAVVEPRLRPGHALRLLLDGQPYGQPTNVTVLQLVNVDRGEHSLALQVIDARQEVVQQSQTQTFTVQRVHLP